MPLGGAKKLKPNKKPPVTERQSRWEGIQQTGEKPFTPGACQQRQIRGSNCLALEWRLLPTARGGARKSFWSHCFRGAGSGPLESGPGSSPGEEVLGGQDSRHGETRTVDGPGLKRRPPFFPCSYFSCVCLYVCVYTSVFCGTYNMQGKARPSPKVICTSPSLLGPRGRPCHVGQWI